MKNKTSVTVETEKQTMTVNLHPQKDGRIFLFVEINGEWFKLLPGTKTLVPVT